MPPAEPNVASSPPPTPAVEPATKEMRLQMMATEHWSLLASRALAWNETFTRAGMFLSTLSFSVVALALVAQASGFGPEFRIFALVVLPVVLFLGVGTALRLENSINHDVMCVIGMNRIRAGYLEMAPDLERFFVMGFTDDIEGVSRTMGMTPNRPFVLALLAATPVVVDVLNAVLLAAILTLLAVQLGAGTGGALVVGAVAFLGAIATLLWWGRRSAMRQMARHEPRFPTAGAKRD